MTETPDLPVNTDELAEIKVVFRDVIIDGQQSVEIALEAPGDYKEKEEPTPAMWFGIYILSRFGTGDLMNDVRQFIAEGQFIQNAMAANNEEGASDSDSD